MKSIRISLKPLIVFCLLSSLFAYQTSNAQPVVIENSVKYINSKTATVVGADGLIMKTKDSGNNWAVETAPTTNLLSSHDFANNFIGMAVGENGTVLITNDAGNSWSISSSGTANNLNDIQSIGTDIWIACGDNGTIIKTNNAGQYWNTISSGTSNNLKDVKFVDLSNGYIIGANAALLKTSTGGNSWTKINMGIGNLNLNAIDMVSLSNGMAAGDNGLILLTFDGGLTWFAPMTNPQQDNIYDIKYLSDTLALASGANGMILKTTDAGMTWNRIELSFLSPDVDLMCVNFYDAKTGISVGEEGTEIYTADGGDTWSDKPPSAWTTINNSDSKINNPESKENMVDLIHNFPNPFNPTTTIYYVLPFDSKISLKVYDLSGREVSELVNGYKEAGTHSVIFNGENLSSGVYFYRIIANDGKHTFAKTMKMLLNK